jgi:hypothetical protein
LLLKIACLKKEISKGMLKEILKLGGKSRRLNFPLKAGKFREKVKEGSKKGRNASKKTIKFNI